MTATTYTVQSRDHTGRWKDVRFSRPVACVEQAIELVRSYDEDGLFSANYRIRDSYGDVVYTVKNWRIDRGEVI